MLGGAQPAAVSTSATRSGSAKTNIPGACGIAFRRGGKCEEAASIGTFMQGFSATGR